MKNDNSIIEGNKLIAEFMDYWSFNDGTPNKIPTPAEIDELSYHTSWDWLMPVCKKFDALFATDDKIFKEWATVNGKKGSVIGKEYISHCDCIDHALTLYEVKKLWDVTVEAIQWYNQTKIKTNEQ